ncbi:MAG: branched-chain amino acid ABC transporter permease [Candidimonas sp.]|nr:MAG: branched-chain amino acid ABC transporter permease [Candidimonas sp.]
MRHGSTLKITAPVRVRWLGVSRLALVSVLVALLGALIPFWTHNAPFLLVLLSDAMIAALVAVSLDMLMGNTGLVSFGHAGWFGLGAYAVGLLARSVTSEMIPLLMMVIVLGIGVSWVVGRIFIRQVGTAFAILTLAFSQVLYALVFLFSKYTGGEDGLQAIPVPTVFGVALSNNDAWYWVLYGILVVAICAALYLRRSPLGKAWIAIRENPERAYFIGLNVARLKLLSFIISGTLATVAGGLFVLFTGATSPDSMSWFESGKMLMYVVMGGVGSVVGPAIGAVVITLAENYISSFTQAWLIYFGALFILVVIVAPNGIFGLFTRLWKLLDPGERGER